MSIIRWYYMCGTSSTALTDNIKIVNLLMNVHIYVVLGGLECVCPCGWVFKCMNVHPVQAWAGMRVHVHPYRVYSTNNEHSHQMHQFKIGRRSIFSQ